MAGTGVPDIPADENSTVPLADFYLPTPSLLCPLCLGEYGEWEGYDGPGEWLVFTEGQAEPDAARRRLSSGGPAQAASASLPGGEHTLFGTCRNRHAALARIRVENGLWCQTSLVDVEGAEPRPLAGDFCIWRVAEGIAAISLARPTTASAIIPAAVTAIGQSKDCILAVRRNRDRDRAAPDEWWVVDLGTSTAHGPVGDQALREFLAGRGLTEPTTMTLPGELP